MNGNGCRFPIDTLAEVIPTVVQRVRGNRSDHNSDRRVFVALDTESTGYESAATSAGARSMRAAAIGHGPSRYHPITVATALFIDPGFITSAI